MATIQSFEQIEAWQRARELYQLVVAACAKPDLARDFQLRDQLRSAAASAVSNIAEGFERNGNAEFHQFLSIAKGSVGEVRAQPYLARDSGYLSVDEFNRITAVPASAERLIGEFMRYLRASTLRGAKYK